MCSRQERIQKDIDIVIQKSRAEKDCLFAGEFLSPGSWDPEPAFPPATPLPRFLTATRAAWVGGSVGLQVPVPGAFGNSCSGVSWSSKEEGGTSPLSPAPPPSSDRPGQPRAPGSAEPARSECRGRALDSSHRRCPEHPPGSGGRGRAGRFAPSAEPRRPGGDRLRRAALLRSAPPRPREKAALGRAPAPLVAPAPRRAHTHRAGDRIGFPGLPSYAGPAWGSLRVHLCSPEAESSSGFSPKPGWGCFRPPCWEIPAVAMAPGTCCGGQTPAAPHGVLGIPSRTVVVPTPRFLALYSLLIGPPWLR